METALYLSILISSVLVISLPSCVNAVAEWGGVNSYFLHALSRSDRVAHLKAMQANGIKVVRIVVVGVDPGAKGSSSVGLSELEPYAVGEFDDDALNKIDALMLEATSYGVKLLIALHDRYSLGCWRRDAYVTKYHIYDVSPNCNTTLNQPRVFYTQANAQADFDRRLVHILTHKNPNFDNRTWGEINEAVFGFEPENEAQGHMEKADWNWTCRRAVTMKRYISNGILIVTGGGVDFETSLVDNHFDCADIDVVSVHDYDTSASVFNSNLAAAKSKAAAHGKRVVMEEFGSTGTDSEKAAILGALIGATADGGIPWLPWEFVKPGNNSNDYEFWTGSEAWRTVAASGKQALTLAGAFLWPEIQ